MGGGCVAGLGLRPKSYHCFWWLPLETCIYLEADKVAALNEVFKDNYRGARSNNRLFVFILSSQMFNNKKRSSPHPAFTPGQEIDKVGLAQNARSTKPSASDSN